MKIVYVLTSDESDFYLEQLSISLYSLKKHNHEVETEIVMDRVSFDALNERRTNLLKLADRILSFDVPPSLNKVERSRWLKTSLRNLINGDYLFLDTDTIICGKLDFATLPIEDFCAVSDLHLNYNIQPFNDDLKKLVKKVEWYPDSSYIEYRNSGVMLVRDTEINKEFYRRWNEEWLKYIEICKFDQPTFGKINASMGYIIKDLPPTWNCQIVENGLRFLHESNIIHYFASGTPLARHAYLINDKFLYQQLREEGMNERIKYLLSNPKSAFISHIHLLSDTDINFYRTPLCTYIRKLYYSNRKIYDNLNLLVTRLSKVLKPINIKKH